MRFSPTLPLKLTFECEEKKVGMWKESPDAAFCIGDAREGA